MQISKKQKNALIRELDSFARAGRSLPSLQPSSKGQKPKTKRRPKGRRNPGSTKMIVDGTGAHIMQDSTVPLSDTFAGSESLGSVNGSSAFTETQFPVNPGQAVTFPRLSQEAKLWEMYEFDELAFEYRTAINQFATNAFGRVTVGLDFDSSDPPPASLSQAEISRPVAAGLPYDSIWLKLRKSDLNGWMKRHFVRPGNLPGTADIKMYDVGVLNFGTSGNVNSNAIGELWVHFRGRFYNQILESVTTPPANFSSSWFQTGTVQTLINGTPATILLAGANPPNGLNIVNTNGSMVPPAGNYSVFPGLTLSDSAAESNSLFMDFQKNGVSVLTSALKPGNSASLGTAAGDRISCSSSMFVVANGTDAFTLVGTANGAAGTLTAAGQVLWSAI
jgi:hypothetical protein